jgi:pimeloyl-ACP methyl ester carboxylesterase
MQSFLLQYKSSTIHCCKAGEGSKLLLCFHGYAQAAESFSFLEKKIGADFTMLAIDFPFHGKTIWNEGLNFTPNNLLEIIHSIADEFLSQEKKINLIGFSMGGRVALTLTQYIPDKIEKLLLLAPDGLKLNFWYWLATQNKAGNKLFKYIMQKPLLMFSFLKAANRMRLVNQSIYKFISYYIYDEKVREDLYKRWTTMRSFRPNIEKIKSIIKENKIPVRMLYGAHDRIIRFERAAKFREGIELFCELKVIPSGHQLLSEDNTDTIIEMLKN